MDFARMHPDYARRQIVGGLDHVRSSFETIAAAELVA
jgi:hypothetical protein